MRNKKEASIQDSKDFPAMVYRDAKKDEPSDILRKRIVYEIADDEEELEFLMDAGYRTSMDKPKSKSKAKSKK